MGTSAPSAQSPPARYIVDALSKLLIHWHMVSLSILNTLSIFSFRMLLLGGKMLKMFILGRSVILMIIFGSCFLLSQRVRQYGPPRSVADLLVIDTESYFRPPQRRLADPGAQSLLLQLGTQCTARSLRVSCTNSFASSSAERFFGGACAASNTSLAYSIEQAGAEDVLSGPFNLAATGMCGGRFADGERWGGSEEMRT